MGRDTTGMYLIKYFLSSCIYSKTVEIYILHFYPQDKTMLKERVGVINMRVI